MAGLLRGEAVLGQGPSWDCWVSEEWSLVPQLSVNRTQISCISTLLGRGVLASASALCMLSHPALWPFHASILHAGEPFHPPAHLFLPRAPREGHS